MNISKGFAKGLKISWPRLLHDRLILDEHVRPCTVYQFRGHLVWDAFKVADCNHLVDQEDRLVVGVNIVDRWVLLFQQVQQCRFIQLHLLFTGDHGEDFQEICLTRAINFDLKENPAQGGLVEDFIRVEVGRKDHQRVEGDFEFFTRLQCQNILGFFQWDDPAVDQALWGFCLTAKVVHDKDAAGRFEL